MGVITEAILDFLREDEFVGVNHDAERNILSFGVSGSHIKMSVRAQIYEDREQVCVYSYLPSLCPEDKRMIMCTFLTRANYGLTLGNFEMDMDDGEIRYKTSIDITDGTLAMGMIKALMYANFSTMNRYSEGIMRIIYTAEDIDIVKLIEWIEDRPTHSEDEDDD